MRAFLAPFLLLTAWALPASAAIQLPALFSDGAVLQRDRPVPVWGKADAGATVKVEFAGQEKTIEAGDDGSWMLKLDPMKVRAEGADLSVRENDGDPLVVRNVRVGEVWLASGQSNMQWAIQQVRQEDQALAADGPVEGLSVFLVPRKLAPLPLDDVDAAWRPAQPDTVRDFSAVAYFFGRRLTEELGVPVGIIASSWGGSRIEPWTPESGFAAVDELAELHRSRLPRLPGTTEYRDAWQRHIAATRAWSESAERSLAAGVPLPPQPAAPPTLSLSHNGETGTWQAMISPLAPYALRGFIWYQGESNLADGMAYRWKKEALVRGWREHFDAPDAPFFYVQLAPFRYGGNRSGMLPEMWVAQTRALEIPNTGMAIINDIGNPRDIHPRNKSAVGHRLARLALADAYGRDLVKSGPLFESFDASGKEITVSFTHTGDGLKTRDGKAPDSFEIAGSDGTFHPATARIDGDRVILTSDAVEQPARVRFAWSEVASPNLVNSADLPASAFHSHWPDDPELGRNVALGRSHVSSDPNPHNWNSGLTDGTWDGEAGRCFATGRKPNFPKHATIDLGTERRVHAIRIGTPAYGSTRTVSVAVSHDGGEFSEVGRQVFEPKSEGRVTLQFDARPARHVRVTFHDHHPKQDHYDPNFAFLREVEVYEATR